MEIKRLMLGQLGVNCYILGKKDAAIVDPGADCGKIIEYLEKEGICIKKILVTHGHFDHVGALCELKEKTGARVYMHKDDISMLGDMEKSLGFMIGETPKKCDIDCIVSDGDEIEVEGEKLFVMHTPGHSGGSVSYIGEMFVLPGDLIFKESIGRYDFGSYCDEMASIKRLLSKIDDDCVILPGHGEATTKKHEMEFNPYVR